MVKLAIASRLAPRQRRPKTLPGHFRYLFLAALGFALYLTASPRRDEGE